MLALFRHARYRRLFSAHVVALIGSGLATVALGLLAYDLAGERATVVLGTALAIKMAAYVAVAPVVGAIADRVPRRMIMLIANLVRGGVVAMLPWITEVWQVFALIAVLQAASATFTPVLQSVLPDILPDEEDYARALSATQVAVSMETLLSPLLAAVALAVVSYSSLFGVTAIGFGISALLVAATVVPPVVRRAGGGFGTRLVLGARLFRATPRLRGLLALNLVVAATGAISLVTTVNVVRDLLGGTEAQVGLLLAVAGGGTAAAALTTPWVLRRIDIRKAMLAGAALSVLAIGAAIALAVAPSWSAAVLAWALIGFGPGWITVLTGRVLRDAATAPQRPALFSAQFSLSHACWLLTYPLTGWLTAAIGFGATWAVLGAIAVSAAAGAVFAWPTRAADQVRHRHEDGTDERHLDTAQRNGDGWTHSHQVVLDDTHPHGPIPV